MIGLIARHEGARLLGLPATWMVSALLSAVFAWFFLQQIESWLAVQERLALTDHAPGLGGFLAARFLAPMTLVFVVVAPLFAMQSFSDEYRQQSFALWQSAPLSSTSLVLGKYLGVLSVVCVPLAVLLLMPLTMLAWVTLDLKVLAAAALGLLLVSAACTAAGLYFSTLTQHSLLAVVGSLALLSLLWLLGDTSVEPLPGSSLAALSPAEHLGGFFQGYVASGDFAYFVLFAVLFLALAIVRIDSLRVRGL